MKRIEYRNPEGHIRVMATNDDGTGLFTRGVNDGAYVQIAGNGQMSFSTRDQFVRHLKRRGILKADLSNLVDEYGW